MRRTPAASVFMLAASMFTLAVLLDPQSLHAQRGRVVPPAPPAADVVAPVQVASPTPPPTDAEGAPLDDAAARQHFESGRAYFQRAQYPEAAREFGEAYRLSGRLALLINVSRAEEGAGRLEDALEALRRWTSLAPADDPERPAMLEREHRLDAAIARAREAAANAPAPEPARPQQERMLTDLQWGGVITLGAGAAVGIGALITGVMAASTHAGLESACDTSGGCPPDRLDDIDRGESLALASTVLSATALAAGAAGLVLLLVGGRSSERVADARPAATSTARLVPGPAQLGAGVAWSF